MLQSPNDSPRSRLGPSLSLKQDLSLDDGLVQRLLLPQPLDILGPMLVSVLESLGKLVVQALEGTDQASSDLDTITLPVTLGGTLDHVIVLLGLLGDNVILVLAQQHGQELVGVIESRDPRIMGNGSQTGRVVESGSDRGEQDTDLLVRRGRNFHQSSEDLDSLGSVDVLPRWTNRC